MRHARHRARVLQRDLAAEAERGESGTGLVMLTCTTHPPVRSMWLPLASAKQGTPTRSISRTVDVRLCSGAVFPAAEGRAPALHRLGPSS